MADPITGYVARFGAGPTAGGAATKEFDIISCALSAKRTKIDHDGIRGTRSHIAQPVTDGIIASNGAVVLKPRPDDLDFWFPYILGGTKSVNDIALAETLPTFISVVDRSVKVYTYAGCKVNKATFRASAGQVVQLAMDIEALTETEGNAGTFPNIASTITTLQPYTLHQGVITIDGTARRVDNLEIVIDNRLVTNLFYNGQTRTALPEGDRIVTLSCDNPYTADDLDLVTAATAGWAGTVVFTNGSYSCTFTFGNLKAMTSQQPDIGGREQVLSNRLNLQAFYTIGGARELVVTNDSTA